MDPGALRARLVEVIEPVTHAGGFDLERLTVSRVGRRRLVRVIIDRDDGVGLDAIAELSRSISTALDAAEETGPMIVPGEYVLEVSSPGVDRPLTEFRHWRRNVGRLVTVAVAEEPATRHLTGRIRAVTATGVVLDVSGSVRELPLARLGPGRVQVELSHVAGEADEEWDEDNHDGDELGGEGA